MGRDVRAVTREELSIYNSDGVVKLPGFVAPERVEKMIVALERQRENPGPWEISGRQSSDRCFGLGQAELASYLLDPTLGENAARAMGSKSARFYFDHMFVVEPNTPVPDHYWHQDLPYWPVQGDHIVSFWLCLVHATPETAGLKFVPGSHAGERFYRPNGFDGKPLDSDLGAFATKAVSADDQFLEGLAPAFHESPTEYGVLEFSYEPGDAVMFSARVVHSSGGNYSPDQRRLAYSARFVGDDARLMLRQGVFQDPALLPDPDEPFEVGGLMASRKWPLVHSY